MIDSLSMRHESSKQGQTNQAHKSNLLLLRLLRFVARRYRVVCLKLCKIFRREIARYVYQDQPLHHLFGLRISFLILLFI